MRTRIWISVCVVMLMGTAVVAREPAPAGHIKRESAPAGRIKQEPAPAGRIKVVSGSVSVVRAGATLPAQAGQTVFETDTVKTGVDGRVGVTLQDDTRISLGPSSEMRLERFSYAPASGQLGVVLKFVRGVAAYVSGRIAKLAPDAVRLETPAAIVGVRGTTLLIQASAE